MVNLRLKCFLIFMALFGAMLFNNGFGQCNDPVEDCPDDCLIYQCFAGICQVSGFKSSGTPCGDKTGCSFCKSLGVCESELYNGDDCSEAGDSCAVCTWGTCVAKHNVPCGTDGCHTCWSGACDTNKPQGTDVECGAKEGCSFCGENGDAGTCVPAPTTTECGDGTDTSCATCSGSGTCDVYKTADTLCGLGNGCEKCSGSGTCEKENKDTKCGDGGCKRCGEDALCDVLRNAGALCGDDLCHSCDGDGNCDGFQDLGFPCGTQYYCNGCDGAGTCCYGDRCEGGPLYQDTEASCDGGDYCNVCDGSGGCDTNTNQDNHKRCSIGISYPTPDLELGLCSGCLKGICTADAFFSPECSCESDLHCNDNDGETIDSCTFWVDKPWGKCQHYPKTCENHSDCAVLDVCVKYRCEGEPESKQCVYENRNNCCEIDADCSSGGGDTCVESTCDTDSSFQDLDVTYYECKHNDIDNCCEGPEDCPPNDGDCVEVACEKENDLFEHKICTITNIPGCCTNHDDCPDDDLPCVDWFCNVDKCEVEEKENCCNGPEDCPTSADECIEIFCNDTSNECVASHNEECCDDVSDGSIANFEGEREYFATCGCNSCCFPKRDCIDHLSWTVETDLEIDYFLLENIDQDGVVVYSEMIYPPVEMPFKIGKRRCKRTPRKYRISFFDTSGKQHGLTTTIVTNQIQI